MAKTPKAPIRAALCVLIAAGLATAPVPALAEKGGNHGHAGHGKPERGQGQGQGQKHGKPSGAQAGAPAAKARAAGPSGGGVDPGAVLAVGATAGLVSALLGGQAQVLDVGAKPLPPGIRKNLARGKPLPPGIARQAVPQPLLARLPAVDGHEWIRVGAQLVLVGIATLVVAQVIDDVFS